MGIKYVFSDPSALARRRERIYEPHVAPLQEMARRVCFAHGRHGGPLFDPDFGGVNARICLLFATPGPAVADVSGAFVRPGTGFVSPDNPDQSAKRTDDTLKAAGIPRSDVVIWNAIPWYLPRKPNGKLNNGSARDMDEAAPALFELFVLCHRLRVLLLGGNVAQSVAERAFRLQPNAFVGYWVIASPHTSPQAMNAAPDRSARLVSAFEKARQLRAATAPGHREALTTHRF